ncbi:hypothetical protein CALVIDRAFT_530976 [Calocera viscosa TUFC12733]|uniref:Uncharacterized protein n=1 Tax=Calocera viscosa (strain TUFC12733) TaxID=1330018 RepID=A0A167H616_CALVF|nr:hypothetical protein CALVIDRAFT_530976 [Calocera viscosa TUFC12733]
MTSVVLDPPPAPPPASPWQVTCLNEAPSIHWPIWAEGPIAYKALRISSENTTSDWELIGFSSASPYFHPTAYGPACGHRSLAAENQGQRQAASLELPMHFRALFHRPTSSPWVPSETDFDLLVGNRDVFFESMPWLSPTISRLYIDKPDKQIDFKLLLDKPDNAMGFSLQPDKLDKQIDFNLLVDKPDRLSNFKLLVNTLDMWRTTQIQMRARHKSDTAEPLTRLDVDGPSIDDLESSSEPRGSFMRTSLLGSSEDSPFLHKKSSCQLVLESSEEHIRVIKLLRDRHSKLWPFKLLPNKPDKQISLKLQLDQLFNLLRWSRQKNLGLFDRTVSQGDNVKIKAVKPEADEAKRKTQQIGRRCTHGELLLLPQFATDKRGIISIHSLLKTSAMRYFYILGSDFTHQPRSLHADDQLWRYPKEHTVTVVRAETRVCLQRIKDSIDMLLFEDQAAMAKLRQLDDLKMYEDECNEIECTQGIAEAMLERKQEIDSQLNMVKARMDGLHTAIATIEARATENRLHLQPIQGYSSTMALVSELLLEENTLNQMLLFDALREANEAQLVPEYWFARIHGFPNTSLAEYYGLQQLSRSYTSAPEHPGSQIPTLPNTLAPEYLGSRRWPYIGFVWLATCSKRSQKMGQRHVTLSVETVSEFWGRDALLEYWQGEGLFDFWGKKPPDVRTCSGCKSVCIEKVSMDRSGEHPGDFGRAFSVCFSHFSTTFKYFTPPLPPEYREDLRASLEVEPVEDYRSSPPKQSPSKQTAIKKSPSKRSPSKLNGRSADENEAKIRCGNTACGKQGNTNLEHNGALHLKPDKLGYLKLVLLSLGKVRYFKLLQAELHKLMYLKLLQVKPDKQTSLKLLEHKRILSYSRRRRLLGHFEALQNIVFNCLVRQCRLIIQRPEGNCWSLRRVRMKSISKPEHVCKKKVVYSRLLSLLSLTQALGRSTSVMLSAQLKLENVSSAELASLQAITRACVPKFSKKKVPPFGSPSHKEKESKSKPSPTDLENDNGGRKRRANSSGSQTSDPNFFDVDDMSDTRPARTASVIVVSSDSSRSASPLEVKKSKPRGIRTSKWPGKRTFGDIRKHLKDAEKAMGKGDTHETAVLKVTKLHVPSSTWSDNLKYLRTASHETIDDFDANPMRLWRDFRLAVIASERKDAGRFQKLKETRKAKKQKNVE